MIDPGTPRAIKAPITPWAATKALRGTSRLAPRSDIAMAASMGPSSRPAGSPMVAKAAERTIESAISAAHCQCWRVSPGCSREGMDAGAIIGGRHGPALSTNEADLRAQSLSMGKVIQPADLGFFSTLVQCGSL